MKAVLSDIHANLEALEAVLKDMKRHRIREFVLLGDVIGYGPNPRECIERLMAAEIALAREPRGSAALLPRKF